MKILGWILGAVGLVIAALLAVIVGRKAFKKDTVVTQSGTTPYQTQQNSFPQSQTPQQNAPIRTTGGGAAGQVANIANAVQGITSSILGIGSNVQSGINMFRGLF